MCGNLLILFFKGYGEVPNLHIGKKNSYPIEKYRLELVLSLLLSQVS